VGAGTNGPKTRPRAWNIEAISVKIVAAWVGIFCINFSTWQGFGELWGHPKQRKYWGDFLAWLTEKYSWAEWQ